MRRGDGGLGDFLHVEDVEGVGGGGDQLFQARGGGLGGRGGARRASAGTGARPRTGRDGREQRARRQPAQEIASAGDCGVGGVMSHGRVPEEHSCVTASRPGNVGASGARGHLLHIPGDQPTRRIRARVVADTPGTSPQRLGHERHQLPDGRVERDAPQRPAAVPFQRAGCAGVGRGRDRGAGRGDLECAQAVFGVGVGPVGDPQMAGGGRVRDIGALEAVLLRGVNVGDRGRDPVGGQGGEGGAHGAARRPARRFDDVRAPGIRLRAAPGRRYLRRRGRDRGSDMDCAAGAGWRGAPGGGDVSEAGSVEPRSRVPGRGGTGSGRARCDGKGAVGGTRTRRSPAGAACFACVASGGASRPSSPAR